MEFHYFNQLSGADDFEDIFKDFNFELLNSPDFKEDAVREEIISPILKKLGYSASGKNKIIRSKTLRNPFYHFGTKSYPINMIPDYTFEMDNKIYWVLEAKSPTEQIKEGKHIYQTYSYAMHHEIQSEMFALCNGKEFILFNKHQLDTPILSFEIKNLKDNWRELKKHLLPEFVVKPYLKNFSLDLGLFLVRIESEVSYQEPLTFEIKAINDIVKLDETTYGLNTIFRIKEFNETKFMGTFDFGGNELQQLLDILPKDIQNAINQKLTKYPFRFSDIKPKETPFKIVALIGNKIYTDQNESFLPFQVLAFRRME